VKTLWIISSALCGIAAVLFVIGEAYDKAFIAAALGAVAWFLSYRVRLRETYDRDDTDETDGQADGEEDQL
jgi:hypothetical protein